MQNFDVLSVLELNENVGRLSEPSKMAGTSWSISAWICQVGGHLSGLAGSVCDGCYAKKGQYVFPSFKKAAARRWRKMRYALSFESSREKFIGSFVSLLNKKKDHTIKRLAEGRKVSCDARYHRWFDSGDLQSTEMALVIFEIARRCPDIQFWMPTRETDYILDAIDREGPPPINIAVRISAHWPDSNPINNAKLIAAGCYLSGVHTEKGNIPETMGDRDGQWSFFECPAWKQDNECRNCRACYPAAYDGHKTIAGSLAVSYPIH